MVRLLNLAGFFRSLFRTLYIPFLPVLERARRKENGTDRRIGSNSVPAGNGDADDLSNFYNYTRLRAISVWKFVRRM